MMKVKMFILSLVVAVSFTGGAFACPCQKLDKQEGTMVEKKVIIAQHHEEKMVKSEAMNIGNTICPVSGESVETMGKPYHVEYNGKVYNLCCKACAETFKKNPEQYSKIAEKEVENLPKGSTMEHKGSTTDHGHGKHEHK
jgi:YHS domain-containing protein